MSDRVNEAAEPRTPTGKAFAQSLMTDGQPGRVRRRPITEWIATIEREATERATAAVDVERLARADWNTTDAGGDDGLTWDTASESLRNDYRDKARRQAAEYAHLSGESEPRHTEGQGDICDPSCPHWEWAAARLSGESE